MKHKIIFEIERLDTGYVIYSKGKRVGCLNMEQVCEIIKHHIIYPKFDYENKINPTKR